MGKHPIAIAAEVVGSFKKLADILCVTKGAVHQWMSPGRKVPIEHCTPIEHATDRQVTRQMLRPEDWLSIWPELTDVGDRAAASDDTQPQVSGITEANTMVRFNRKEAA